MLGRFKYIDQRPPPYEVVRDRVDRLIDGIGQSYARYNRAILPRFPLRSTTICLPRETWCDSIATIGSDKLMFEVDFPHNDGPFPKTLEHITTQFAGVDAETRYNILRGNAIKLFGLEPDQ